jgi:uncharacterized protein
MVFFAFVWLASVVLLTVIGLGFAITVPMMRRRIPNEPDQPALHGMSCEHVTFTTQDDLTLAGWWIPAQGAAQGTVIMCPGQNGSMDSDLPQAKPLHEAGFNVLMFDLRAHGGSEGELVTWGVLEQLDLMAALDYVQAAHGVERAGVFGFSMGAAVALLVAAQDDRVAALALDGAYPRLSGILIGWGRLKGLPGVLARAATWAILLIGSLRARYQLYRANPIELAADVTAPALFVHGEQDPFVAWRELAPLTERVNGPVAVWRVPDAGHREAFGQQPAAYNRRVVEWFARHL